MSERFALTQENKGAADQALDFPKLNLKKGEAARLALFSLQTGADGKKGLAVPAPEGGYFFGIRKPNGDFGGSFECIASDEAKEADEYDGDSCPHCKAVSEGAPEAIIESRKRRFVMHVIRYRTAPGSGNLTQPFSVEALAWRFTDRYFNTLVDENTKWTEGNVPGLLGHDITMICEVEQYQNYKVSVEPQSAWRSDQELGKLVLGTYAAAVEMAPLLKRQLGSSLTKEQLVTKVEEALRTYGMVEDQLAAGGMVQPNMESIAGLADDLFGSLGAIPLTEEAASVVAPEVGVEPVAAEVAELTTEAVVAPDDGVIDFDKFFEPKK